MASERATAATMGEASAGCAHCVPQLGTAFQKRPDEVLDLGQQLTPLRRQQACEDSVLEPAAASKGVSGSSRDTTSSMRAVALWPITRAVAVPRLMSKLFKDRLLLGF